MEPTATVAELNQKFGIPRIAEVIAGNGGLPKVHVTSAVAVGEIYLHGAHVTSWWPRNSEEALFVSSATKWQDGKAIRGGVPISFPWFADKADDPKAPAHGFVRTKSWSLDSIMTNEEVVTVTMSTASDESTRQWWPHDFRAIYRASFSGQLRLELEVHNAGSNGMRFEEALHAYFRVGDVISARVKGLNGVHFLDKTDQYREKIQQRDVMIASETDSVYLNTETPAELVDPVLRRRIGIAKEHSRTTVIWNPWSEKASAMSDLGTGEWEQMLCVETSNVLDYAVELAPAEIHRMLALISV